MPKVPFTAFFQGPLAVYPSPTAQSDPVTGGIYLGTDFIEGNYADVSNEDAQQWNYQFGTQLKGGRYRICRLATNAIAANLPQVAGQGAIVGWAAGTFVGSATIANAGTGYANGTFNVVSTNNIGSQAAAVAQVVVSGGIIISAGIIQGGGPFLIAPTFSLSELTGGSSASLIANLFQSSSFVTSFDSTSAGVGSSGIPVMAPRGITYAAPTAAQILAGSWIVVQESGIANPYIGTASANTLGQQVVATTPAAAGVAKGAATAQAFVGTAQNLNVQIGFALAAPFAGATCPVLLTLPTVED
jgi:hypothetical protein